MMIVVVIGQTYTRQTTRAWHLLHDGGGGKEEGNQDQVACEADTAPRADSNQYRHVNYTWKNSGFCLALVLCPLVNIGLAGSGADHGLTNDIKIVITLAWARFKPLYPTSLIHI